MPPTADCIGTKKSYTLKMYCKSVMIKNKNNNKNKVDRSGIEPEASTN